MLDAVGIVRRDSMRFLETAPMVLASSAHTRPAFYAGSGNYQVWPPEGDCRTEGKLE